MTQESNSRRMAAPGNLAGVVWFAGWWKIILAIVVWPYFLGLAVR